MMNMNKIVSNVTDARNFAKKKHAGQLRKNGKTTTFSHLKEVVKNLKKMKVTNEDTICAGWLHDTIEDTNISTNEITETFGSQISELVQGLTKISKFSLKIIIFMRL